MKTFLSAANDFRRYAMTAMHCVEEASSLVVALGEHNIRTDIENHQAKVVLMIMIRCEDGVDKEEGVVSCPTIWLLIFASDICKEIELCAIYELR